MKRLVVAMALCGLAVGAFVLVPAALASFPGKNGRLALTQAVQDGRLLYSVEPDGTDIVHGSDTTGWTLTDWQAIPGPKRSDYKNSNQFCRAEQTFWGDQFASRYGGGSNAYGKCVSAK